LEPKPPPRILEAESERGRTRQAAWGCVLSNLVLPGLGTFMARRRVAGILQLAVSQTGFALTLVWALLFVREWVRLGRFPADVAPHLALGFTGAMLFLFAWVWSLISSVGILLRSRKSGL